MHRIPTRIAAVTALTALTALAAFGVGAAPTPETTSYVVRLGQDTLSLEQVTRTPTQVRGRYVARSPRTFDRTYVMDLLPDGTVRRFEMVTLTPGPGAPAVGSRATIEFTGDSAIVVTPRGDSSVTQRMAAASGAAPYLNGVMGLLEQIGRQAKAAGGSRYALAVISPGAREPTRASVVRAGGDTLRLAFETALGTVPPLAFALDPAGRLTWFDGRGSTFQAVAERVPALDLAAARAMFERRPLGTLSSRDTVRAALGGDTLWIAYGRPLKRGREVFGNVVPWNTVWRTGANAATQLHVPVALTIGGAAVPAGDYTLWTLPSPGGWKLIINRQTGQWGTQYDAAQDLARVDLRIETLAQPVERFTIEIETNDAGGMLCLSWDRTRLTAPIRR